MLNSEQRELLSDIVLLPDDCQLLNLFGTTYSCTFDMLMAIVLWADGTMKTLDDLHSLERLKSLLASHDRISLWCNRGYARIRKPSLLYGLLNDCLQEVLPAEESSFHPKLLLMRYLFGKDTIKYRLVVTSRNFVETDDWDVIFSVDGELQPHVNEMGSQLAEFLQYVTSGKIPPAILQELEHVSFDFPVLGGKRPAKTMEFYFQKSMSQPSPLELAIPNHAKHAIVVAPFIDRTFLDLLQKRCESTPIIISNQRELDNLCLQKTERDRFELHTVDGPVPVQDVEEEAGEADADEITSISLHAKVYAFDDESGFYLLFGSSNATRRGWLGNNTEVMIRLRFDNYSVRQFIEDSFYRDESWVSYIQNYIPQEPKTDQAKEAIELIHSAASRISVCMAVIPGDSQFSLHVSDVQLVQQLLDQEGLRVTIQPLHEAGAQEYDLVDIAGSPKYIKYESIADITPFVLLHICNNVKAVKSFALKATIDWGGITPDEKARAVIRKVISDSSKFFAYLRFLISDIILDENDMGLFQPSAHGGASGETPGEVGMVGFTIEEMLRALNEDPARIFRIEQFINLCQNIEEYNKYPDISAFFALWQQLKTVFPLEVK